MSEFILQLNSEPHFKVHFLIYFCTCVQGSEGSLFTKKKSNSIAVADLYCREMACQRGSPTLLRHCYSVVSQIHAHPRFLSPST